jgi:hypothetical protein
VHGDALGDHDWAPSGSLGYFRGPLARSGACRHGALGVHHRGTAFGCGGVVKNADGSVDVYFGSGVEGGVKSLSRLNAIPVISRQQYLAASTFPHRAAKSKAVSPSANTIA